MRKDRVLEILKNNRNRLKRFHVESLAVFGSVARDEATAGSDIDILVEFEQGSEVGLFEFIRLKQVLEELLGCGVDLATPDAIREEMRDKILREAIRAA